LKLLKFKKRDHTRKQYECVLLKENRASLKFNRERQVKLNWLIPNLDVGGGGHLNIFRFIKQLEEMKFDIQVYIVGGCKSIKQSNLIIQNHYPKIEKEAIALEIVDQPRDCDGIVATGWQSAYFARHYGNCVEKFYFVQDMEDQFYAQGSLSSFAAQTYRFGFYGLTAGSWIKDSVLEKFNMPASSFSFSYDKGVYQVKNSSKQGKKKVLFYARSKTARRGFELGIMTFYLLSEQDKDLEFIFVGMEDNRVTYPFPVTFKGILSLTELADLYNECDVSLIISHTNLSLLPLEIMACGCPVVSNNGDNVTWLVNEKNALVVEETPEALSNALTKALYDEPLREKLIEGGLKSAQESDWTEEIRHIGDAIQSRLENA
jgi:O-antigen biosynthesis protein